MTRDEETIIKDVQYKIAAIINDADEIKNNGRAKDIKNLALACEKDLQRIHLLNTPALSLKR